MINPLEKSIGRGEKKEKEKKMVPIFFQGGR